MLGKVAKHCGVSLIDTSSTDAWAKSRGLPWDKARLKDELQCFSDLFQQEYDQPSHFFPHSLLAHLLRCDGDEPDWARPLLDFRMSTPIDQVLASMLALL